MVCSKLDSASEVRNMEGQQDSGKNGAIQLNVRELEILTMEGQMLKVNVEKNTTVRAVKIDCELLCGVPSDLQILHCRGRELDNDATLADLELPHGCPLRLTVPQWWLKFVCTCFKGHTLQVRKRIFVKMSQMSREERTFTAAFIAAIKGNHSLLFAAFAGRKVNVHSRAELSGRTLLHAAISGGNTSCVANILMNGGSALLETPDNAGETPVQMAKKLHGDEGEIVNFLNIYLELHQREKKHSGYWDDLEHNNINNRDVDISGNQTENSDKNGFECGKAEHGFEDSVDRNPEANLDEHFVELKRSSCTETEPINNSIFANDTNVKDCEAIISDKRALIPVSVCAATDAFNCSRQETQKTLDIENRSNHDEIAERCTEMFNNKEVFTQEAKTPIVMTKQVNLGDQTDGDDVTNLSMVSATSGESDIGNSPKPPRRAHMRKQAFLEQRRKQSATERPNIRQLIIPDRSCYHEQGNDDSNEEESNDRRGTSLTANDVLRVWQHHDTTTSGKSTCEADVTSSPKPLRRAHLRKQAFLEQHRKRSATERPCLGRLAAIGSIGSGGETTSEACDKLEPEECGGLDACQDQEVTNVSMTSVPSGDECNAGRSPKMQRRAHQRKQAFLEQRRRISTTERSNIDQLIILDTKGKYVADNEDATKDSTERDGTSVQTNLEGLCSNMDEVPDKRELSIKLSSSEGSDRPKQLSPLPPARKNQNNLPVRRFRQRYLQSSPTWEARQLLEDVSSQGSWSSVSGDDSEDSSREQNVVEETVARVIDPQNNRRRRLPLVPLPDKNLKLPLIKIEDSGDCETHLDHVLTPSLMRSSGQVTRGRNSSVEDPTSPSYNVPHRPALPISRPRSGSTCSEESLSSGETPLVRSRAHSEGENVVPIKTVMTSLRPSKSCPVRQRRTSVPNSTFDPVVQNLQIRGRRYSVQVDQGYQINSQLRCRLATGGAQRERMPWNQWRAVKRTAFITDESDGENSEDDDLDQKGRSTEVYDFALKEKNQRPKSGKPSRISFAEWLESKEALIKARPESARPRSGSLGQTNINDRQLQAAEKYQQWLKRKDQEALEKEERLLLEGRRSSKRHTKQTEEDSRRGSQGSVNTER